MITAFLNTHASAIGATGEWAIVQPIFLKKFREESGDQYYDASQDISFVLSQKDNTINILVYAVSYCPSISLSERTVCDQSGMYGSPIISVVPV